MNIDALVENFYSKIDDNEDLINEVLQFLLVEADASMPPRARFDWSMIPDIPVSEIGWSDVTTTDKGVDIPSEQRALLMQYLNNIGSPGASFEQQIQSLQEFYGPTGPDMVMASASTNAEAITKLISYLVFYKTLTKVVTNFNASSAGFSFESFLAVLLNGEQVKANTGTIADFTTGDNIPISLKLYTKLHVGGSWRDLVGDITNPKFAHPKSGGYAMRYISGIKKLKGEGLDQEGEIKLYQFDITIDNIVDMMLDSMHPDIVKMPRSLIDGDRDLASTLPSAEQLPTNEEMEEVLIAEFAKRYVDIEVPEVMAEIDPNFPSKEFLDGPNGVFDVLAYPKSDGKHNKALFNTWKGLALTPFKTGLALYRLVNEVFQSKYSQTSGYQNLKGRQRKEIELYLRQLAALIGGIHNKMIAKFGSTEVAKARAAALKGVDWISVKRGKKAETEYNAQIEGNHEEIREYYNGLDLEGKKRALLNTYGVVVGGAGGITQWDLNEKQATNPNYPVEAEYLGELQIGGAYVEAMLKQVSAILDEEIFAVFTSLKTLSDNLNGFFAGGLADDSKAVTAIGSAQDIEKKTTDLKGEK